MDDLTACLVKLQAHDAQIQDVLDLIDAGRRPGREQISLAKSALGVVKDAINTAYRAGSTNRGRAQLTDAERRYYQPAVHEASTRLPSLSTRPGPEWAYKLHDAQDTLRWYIHELTSEIGVRGE